MNQCVMLGNDVWTPARSYKLQYFDPQSCNSEYEKVANLRTLVRDIEGQISEVEWLGEKLEFLASAELMSAVIMETSVGFLDLAASAFASINPAASKAAQAGVMVVKSNTLMSHAYTNHFAQSGRPEDLSEDARPRSFSELDDKIKLVRGKILLNKAKTAYDTALLGIKSNTGISEKNMRKEIQQNAGSNTSEDLGLMSGGLKQGGLNTTGSTLRGLVIIGDMYVAGQRYHDALGKRFETHDEEITSNESWILSQKTSLRRVLGNLRGQLDRAVAALEACQS